MDCRIVGGQVLHNGALESTSVHADAATGLIADVGADRPAKNTIDANGLLVMPGIVDIHGDAFERQMMPRPGVEFSLDIALLDSDHQVIANGITTVFHGVTWSWEPGLRGTENARGILNAIETLRPRLAADTRFHLRHETFNLEAEAEIAEWLAARRIHALAFNDHMPSGDAHRPDKIGQMAQRAGLSIDEFMALVQRLRARGNEVPHSIARLAELAKANGIPLLSHDDTSPEQRQWFRALGCRVSEFPMNAETAQAAADEGDSIVMGAPNVMRGKSHIGWASATEMIARGLCSVLASDYYYPAQLIAAFRLADIGVAPIEKAWPLVSESPARAVGLNDRGSIEPGLRADLILIDPRVAARPRVVAVMVAGRMVHLTEADRVAH